VSKKVWNSVIIFRSHMQLYPTVLRYEAVGILPSVPVRPLKK